MIEYIKGDIAEITPATVVLDCNGMGYGINISLNTYSAIQNQSNTKLYIMKRSGKTLRTLRILDQTGTGVVFVTDFRIGHRRQHGTYDSVGLIPFRAVRSNQFR